MMFDAITTMAPNVRAGKLTALGTSGRSRSTVLPEVPTVSEAGVPGYEAVIWLGVMAPAGTPKAIVDRLNAASLARRTPRKCARRGPGRARRRCR